MAALRLTPDYDDGPGLVRVGVILFNEDITTEGAIAKLRPPGDAIAVFVSRMPLPVDSSPVGLARTLGDITAAAALLAPSARLDVIAYSCTTGTIEVGYEAISEAIGRARPGVPVATPITGALKAFAALGVQRLALLTPYGDALNGLISGHLANQGLEVVRHATFAVAHQPDFVRVSLASLRAGALAAMPAEAEALFISCTALRGTDLIGDLEQALGRPVVTSTQAMWWEALRLAGCKAAPTGAGRLSQL